MSNDRESIVEPNDMASGDYIASLHMAWLGSNSIHIYVSAILFTSSVCSLVTLHQTA